MENRRSPLNYFIFGLLISFAFYVFRLCLGILEFTLVESILVTAIIFVLTFILFLLYTKFYKKKKFGYATLGQRWFAEFLDIIVINLILYGSLYVFAITESNTVAVVVRELYDVLGGKFNFTMVLVVGYSALYFIYATLCEMSRLQATLGAYYLDLRVTGQDGKKAPATKILMRNILKMVVGLPFVFIFYYTFDAHIVSLKTASRSLLLFYLYPKLNTTRSALYDYLTGTFVLNVSRGNVLTQEKPKKLGYNEGLKVKVVEEEW